MTLVLSSVSTIWKRTFGEFAEYFDNISHILFFCSLFNRSVRRVFSPRPLDNFLSTQCISWHFVETCLPTTSLIFWQTVIYSQIYREGHSCPCRFSSQSMPSAAFSPFTCIVHHLEDKIWGLRKILSHSSRSSNLDYWYHRLQRSCPYHWPHSRHHRSHASSLYHVSKLHWRSYLSYF